MLYEPHPLRIRLSRKAGYRKPMGAVVVVRPSKWGNPFPFDDVQTRADAVEKYRKWICRQIASGQLDPNELRGKQLACWCPLDQPCHADELARLANQ